jgi:sugar transferase EpsL
VTSRGKSIARTGVKRATDIAGAALGLIICSPLVVVAAVISWRAFGRPVLVHHQRAGRHGAPIDVVKLRTMTDERDESGRLLPDEQRLTPAGARLRRWSLDELPQLWTVLTGVMSLVGPRPLPVTYVDRYDEAQRRRLLVKPGMTGWAQVHGRNVLSWPDRLALDVWYVEHCSIVVDMRILIRTIGAVLSGRGVSADGHATMTEFLGDEQTPRGQEQKSPPC